MLTLYDSIGDQTLSTGTGSLVGSNAAINARYAPPITGHAGDVVNGARTAIRIETSNGTMWEVCETVPALASDIFTYTRGTLLKSSTGSRIDFPAGTKLIRFVAPAEAFQNPIWIVGAPVTGTIDGVNTSFVLPFTPGTDPLGNAAVMLVAAGGVLAHGYDYSLSGTNVTMTWAPTIGPILAFGNT